MGGADVAAFCRVTVEIIEEVCPGLLFGFRV